MTFSKLSETPAYLIQKVEGATPIQIVEKDKLNDWLETLSVKGSHWVQAQGPLDTSFKLIPLSSDEGHISRFIAILGAKDLGSFGKIPAQLPEGQYVFEGLEKDELETAALGWALSQYRFTRYVSSTEPPRILETDSDIVNRLVNATYLTRDLINTPTNDMGPTELAAAAEAYAETYGATYNICVGDELLTENFPAIHAVGRAAVDAPRLIDMRWGDENHPKVTIVGKGVCFDTGGLDIKPGAGMRLMKKDMGGAAHALALAAMIMDAGLPICLRLLIPAVENAIAGNAYRPGDVIETRKGLSIEVGNTDAEGRIVLCDALALADEEEPELIIDFATLTGAARVALGPDLPAMFTHDEELANSISSIGLDIEDPVWRMPLWQGYKDTLKSPIADLNNISDGPFAGAITAALYLEHFVEKAKSWVHFDVFGWNASSRPHRPKGGEAMALRATFAYLEDRFAPSKK